MRYSVLGPVEIIADGQPVTLDRPQRRALLALLLLHANQVVSIDQIIDALWGGAPPATARAQLHALVAAVRRVLREAGAGDVIATRASGYALTVADSDVDLRQFDILIERARIATDPAEAAGLLREALALWRGTALDGISAAFVEPARARLDERRLATYERLVDLELARGQHRELVGELTALVAAHPLRERLVGQLMTALYRSGRQSEALQAARTLRRVLADEEGLDPSPPLVELETAILRADPALASPVTDHIVAPATAPIPEPLAGIVTDPPRQLPPDVADFVGRNAELDRLDRLAERDEPARCAVLSGVPGVGKTALAVRWAHHAVASFPDGQLYVNGASTAAEVVGEVLRAFGVPVDDLPTEQREAGATYQALVAGRRVLVIVDDVRDPAVIRALLPSTGRSMVLVTEAGVDSGAAGPPGGGTRIRLSPLPADESVRLIGALAGDDRVHHEPEAAGLLARACGHLPLGLLLAGADLAHHPDRTVQEQAERTGSGPDDAPGEQEGVAAAFAVAHAGLSAAQRRLLHLLAVAPGPDATAVSAAALSGTATVQPLLDRLVQARLLTASAAGRFAQHPALRSLAADRGDADAECDTTAAMDRLAAYWLGGADAAARLLYPHLVRLPVPVADGGPSFGTAADALHWLESERENLVAAIEHAAGSGRGADAWLLADTLRGYFSQQMRTADWERAARAALAAAQEHGSVAARSAGHLSLAELHLRASRHPGALRDAWQVLATTDRFTEARPAGWPAAERAPALPTPRKRPATTSRLLLSLVLVLLLSASTVVTGAAADDLSGGTGAARVVHGWSVAVLRQDEAIDFDAAGRLAFDKAAGMDISPWGAGNSLSGKTDAMLAVLPVGVRPDYQGCTAIPADRRVRFLRGLYDLSDGRRICVWTKPGRVALLTLTRAPRRTQPDLIFDYVVWQGTAAPPTATSPRVPPQTEIARSVVGTLLDPQGIDIDGGGAIASQDAPGIDVTPYGKGNTLKIKASAHITLLPDGSPGTYAACAAVPEDRRVVAVSGLRDLSVGRRICLYAFSGRIAMLTLARVPKPTVPPAFDLVVWQGEQRGGPAEPPPWGDGPVVPPTAPPVPEKPSA